MSKPFCELSHDLVYQLPDNPEKDVALRKLLEAKDAAIRSSITKGANNEQAKVSIADSERDGEGVHILPIPESEK